MPTEYASFESFLNSVSRRPKTVQILQYDEIKIIYRPAKNEMAPNLIGRMIVQYPILPIYDVGFWPSEAAIFNNYEYETIDDLLAELISNADITLRKIKHWNNLWAELYNTGYKNYTEVAEALAEKDFNKIGFDEIRNLLLKLKEE